MPKNITIFLITATAIAAIFLIFPQIDIWATGFFYNSSEGFFLDNRWPLLNYIHKSVRFITTGIALLWIGLLIFNVVAKKEFFGLGRRKLAYLIVALALGPGLVVNVIFKDQWGRARPHHVTEFGGNRIFTPPFIISDQCDKNCSFVSGDPSVGFYFFALAFAMPNRKKLFQGTALGLGGLFGAVRIMQGGHFLSDVIFSGVFTFAVCWVLWKSVRV